MATLLGAVRRKMLSVGLPAVLADLDEHGALWPESVVKPADQAPSSVPRSSA